MNFLLCFVKAFLLGPKITVSIPVSLALNLQGVPFILSLIMSFVTGYRVRYKVAMRQSCRVQRSDKTDPRYFFP